MCDLTNWVNVICIVLKNIQYLSEQNFLCSKGRKQSLPRAKYNIGAWKRVLNDSLLGVFARQTYAIRYSVTKLVKQGVLVRHKSAILSMLLN